jgi:hypothetical protein
VPLSAFHLASGTKWRESCLYRSKPELHVFAFYESPEASWQSIVGPTTIQSVLAQRQQAGAANYVKQLSLPPTGQSLSVDSNAGPKSSQAAPSQQFGSGTTSMTSSHGVFV